MTQEKTTTVVLVDPKEFGLEPEQAKEVESVFLPVIAERESLIDDYTKIVNHEITKELTIVARELRLKLVKIRTNTDRIHKTTKAFYLAGGRFVDAWKNKNVTVIETMENKLREIEDYYVNIEKERLIRLQNERSQEVFKYGVDGSQMPLGMMSDDVWNNYLTGSRLAYENKLAEEEKARQAEIEKQRIRDLHNDRYRQAIPYFNYWSEFEKTLNFGEVSQSDFDDFMVRIKKAKADYDTAQEAIRQENERLRKDSEANAEKLRIEKEKAAEALRKEREKVAELQRIAREENDRIRLEELQRKQAEKEKAAAEKKAARQPDKVKIVTWCEQFSIDLPTCSSQEAHDLVVKFRGDVAMLVDRLQTEAENL